MREFQPEIVLMDIGLPDITGYDVVRELRQFPELQDTIFIALTGYGEASERRRSREAGFHHHVLKPANWQALEKLFQPTCLG